MRAAVMYGVPDVRIETVPDARINVTATTTQGLKITAQGGGTWTRSETIVLGPGTVFACGREGRPVGADVATTSAPGHLAHLDSRSTSDATRLSCHCATVFEPTQERVAQSKSLKCALARCASNASRFA